MEYMVLLGIVIFTVWITTRIYYKAEEAEHIRNHDPVLERIKCDEQTDRLETIQETVDTNQELIRELKKDVKELKS